MISFSCSSHTPTCISPLFSHWFLVFLGIRSPGVSIFEQMIPHHLTNLSPCVRLMPPQVHNLRWSYDFVCSIVRPFICICWLFFCIGPLLSQYFLVHFILSGPSCQLRQWYKFSTYTLSTHYLLIAIFFRIIYLLICSIITSSSFNLPSSASTVIGVSQICRGVVTYNSS